MEEITALIVHLSRDRRVRSGDINTATVFNSCIKDAEYEDIMSIMSLLPVQQHLAPS